jgi:hypothetical protein
MLQALDSIKEGELLITIPSNAENRKKFHNFLEKTYPNLQHRSIPCGQLKRTFVRRDMKCFDCGKKVRLTYREGNEPNNIDESWRGECLKCDESVVWECNYDDHDDVISVTRPGKFFVIGLNSKILKRTDFPTETNDPMECTYTFLKIKEPKKIIKDGQLGGYIFRTLTNNMCRAACRTIVGVHKFRQSRLNKIPIGILHIITRMIWKSRMMFRLQRNEY